MDLVLQLLYLTLFSVVGVLCRVVLGMVLFQSLHTSSEELLSGTLHADVYSNIIGSLLIGILHMHKKALNGDIFVGLSTGLCGCLTTFSGWQTRQSRKFFHYRSITLSTFILGLVQDCLLWAGCVVLGMSIGDLWGGKEKVEKNEQSGQEKAVARTGASEAVEDGKESGIISHSEEREEGNESGHNIQVKQGSRINNILVWIVLSLALLVVATTLVVGAVLLNGDLQIVALAMLLGPLGCFGRFGLSLAKKSQWCLAWASDLFPIFTLAANTLACIVMGASILVDEKTTSSNVHLWMNAIRIGLCGCLSTVSTLALEWITLPAWWARLYAVISVVAAHTVLLFILG